MASKDLQVYRLPYEALLNYCRSLLARGYTEADFLIDESAPDHRVQLQAEVMRDEQYLYVMYALATGVGIRQVKQWSHARGLRAKMLLDAYLDPNARTCLNEIFDGYPDSVIELSTYDCAVGVLGWNTIVWEVRDY